MWCGWPCAHQARNRELLESRVSVVIGLQRAAILTPDRKREVSAEPNHCCDTVPPVSRNFTLTPTSSLLPHQDPACKNTLRATAARHISRVRYLQINTPTALQPPNHNHGAWKMGYVISSGAVRAHPPHANYALRDTGANVRFDR